jgi:single-stranded DNA-specific DHH superfamily exonuclease
MTDTDSATASDDDDEEPELEESSDDDSDSESDVASPEIDEQETEDQLMYTTPEAQDAFDPTMQGTVESLQWNRALKWVYEKYIDDTKQLKKQKHSMERYQFFNLFIAAVF